MKKRVEWLLVISILLLAIFGLVMIYSASSIWAEYKFHDSFRFVKNQAIFLGIGILLMCIISKIPYHHYYDKASWIIGLCVVLLILVLIPGIGSVRNGSRSWFGIGPFGIQPSEFTKLGLAIFTSKYVSTHKKFYPVLIFTFLIFGLIMLQPDFGTGTILVMSILGILFVAGMHLSFLIKLGVVGVIGVVILVLIAPYRLARILSFLNPWSDPLGSGFQMIQSLYAIGPGGLFGMGFGNSIQKHFYLPEPQTDFIFSIISEEFGFMGIVIVATLFLTIIITGFQIAIHTKDAFGKYLAFGIMFGFSFQTVLNLMVVVGLLPVTGVTLLLYS